MIKSHHPSTFMDSSSSNEQVIDRISTLSDSLLVHILSFLDVFQAVQTGILSSRWRGLWTSLPSLDFDQYHYKNLEGFDPIDEEEDPHQPYNWFDFLNNDIDSASDSDSDYDYDDYDDDTYDDDDDVDDSVSDNADDFIKFVERSLVLHVAPKVNKFSLTCYYSKKFDSFIDSWLLSAVRRDVKELYLVFPEKIDGVYNLPSWLFKCECLISLSLDGCSVGVPKYVCLNSLLSLTLSWICLEVGSVPALLDGCPLLEELVLDKCELSSGRLRILPSSSSSDLRLKRLTLACCSNQSGDEIGLEVHAPHLEILSLRGVKVYNNSLRNVLPLREAYLDFYFSSWNPKLPHSLELWLQDLDNVKVLGLSSCCIKVLYFLGERYQPSYSSKTKCLILESELQRSELPGLANLLSHSHDLENLIIKLTPGIFPNSDQRPSENDFDNEYWERLKFSFPCMLHCLMTVKISGFMGSKCRSAGFMVQEDISTVNRDAVSNFFERQDTEIEIVRFFLTNAVALKKMTIQFCHKPDFLEGEEWSKILLLVSQKFNAIPRASSCAVLSLLYK